MGTLLSSKSIDRIMKFLAQSATLLTAAFFISACSSDPATPTVVAPVQSAQTSTPAPGQPKEVKNSAPAPALTETQRATALWKKIQGFKTWNSPPGFPGLVESDSVHGDFVRFYANGTALADMKKLPNGSIIVKEGFEDDQGDLNAITVMEKIEGFSQDSGDWLFTRFDVEGKASKINSSSCIRCHQKADGGDFSFAND